MKKRELQKLNTRNKITDVAENLFCEKGIINTKTIDIAKAAGIAHGTLFSHFETRDLLVETILNKKLEHFTEQFLETSHNQPQFFTAVNKLLDLIALHEVFFSVIFRELPLVNENLRNMIIYRFSIIELYVLKMFEAYLSSNSINTTLNPEIIIQHFFSLIIHYLNFRQILNFRTSVIMERKQTIMDTLTFFINGGRKHE